MTPRSARAGRAPHPGLRSLRSGGYAGWMRPPERAGRFVLPATMSAVLVMKVEDSAVRPPEFVEGVRPRHTVIEGGCAPVYVEITLSPLGAYQVFGTPMHHLTGQLVDFRDVLGGGARQLGDVVRDARTWDERFDAIDEFFLRRIDTAPVVDAEVAFAWQQLVATGGAIPIRSICRQIGWSNKHLITRFRQHVGLAPKRAARVIRFERVLRRIAHDPAPDWGRVAADCGYADQAHLIRDFGEFSGTTPAAAVRAKGSVLAAT
jgi:AraC-like DNA-binding protein